MDGKMKKIGTGLLKGLVATIATLLASIVGWIVYSKKFINHKQGLSGALDADRLEVSPPNVGKLSYYVDLSGKGTPLVLLHSINAAPSAFEVKPIFDHYRGKRPVYALDLPGFGFSDRSDRLYSPQLYQDAIVAFLRDVVKKPADVVALSLSNEFAALAAVHSPEWIRSLAMLSPTGFKPPLTDKISQRARRRGTRNNLYAGLAVPLWNRPFYDLVSSRASIQYFLSQSFEGYVPPSFVDYAYTTAHQPGAEFAPTYFLSGKLFTPAVRTTVYKVMEQPVVVLYDQDPYSNFEMLPGFLQEQEKWQAERITPTKGLPHWEQPEKTFSALEDFWAEL
jgi:pimeloyl-ACP methyl ester carboxylesterase